MIIDYFKFQQYVYSIIINMDWLWTDSLYSETNMLVEENIGKDHERNTDALLSSRWDGTLK